MPSFSFLWRKLSRLLHRKRFHRELQEEMEFHRAATEEALVDEGVPAQAARHSASRRFGNATRLHEQSHEVVRFRMEAVAQDARFALRQLRRSPAFAITAILVLGLAFCSNVTVFAFVDAALIRPLPYPQPNRLVGIFSSIAAGPMYCLSYLDFLDWKRENHALQAMEAYTTGPVTLQTPQGALLVHAVQVTDGFFRTLGVAPALGRGFYAGEGGPDKPRAVLLSYAAWQARYGGRADVLGTTVMLDHVPSTIVGVLPTSFRFAPAEPAEYWSTLDPGNGCERRRICHDLFAVGRLRDGISVQQAGNELARIAASLEKMYPESNRGQGAAVFSMKDTIVGNVRPLLWTLLLGTGLLMAIACVNIAGLLLLRSEERRREMALREALGASRRQLLRLFLIEAAIVAGAGCALGGAGVAALFSVAPRLIPEDLSAGLPFLTRMGMGTHLAAYASIVVLLVWALFALVPMIRLPKGDLRKSLAEGGRSAAGLGWRRLGGSFVVAELAMAIVLLTGAGLLTKTVYRLLHVDTGMRTDHLAVLSVGATPPPGATKQDATVLGSEIVRQIEALPGVRSAGISNSLPLRGYGPFFDFTVHGRPTSHGDHYEATLRQISRGYFATLGARLERGHLFSAADGSTTKSVGVINRSFARAFFPNEDPIGKEITYTGPAVPPIEIIGVIDDVHEGELNAASAPAFYELFDQNPAFWFSVVVDTEQDPAAALSQVVQTVRQGHAGLAIYDPGTMQQLLSDAPVVYLHRAAAWLAGGFAALALLLGVVGLYGVIAYSVGQRTREIGVRMALGAQRSTVYGMVLREALRLTLVGIAAGVGGSLATATLLRPLLFGVRPWDVSTLAAVAALLGVAAMLASFVPARRAASVNPVEALRAE